MLPTRHLRAGGPGGAPGEASGACTAACNAVVASWLPLLTRKNSTRKDAHRMKTQVVRLLWMCTGLP